VELVHSPVNGGFAAGNNFAIAPALAGDDPPDLIWLLNPDTLVRPGALDALLAFLEDRSDVGIAGSRLEWEDGTQHDSRYRFPGILNQFDAHLAFPPFAKLVWRWRVAPDLVLEDHPIDWMAGASMIIRREVFERIGLFDDGYFMYFEETDFCLRASRAGFLGWYVPQSRVAHLVGKSSKVSAVRDSVQPRLPRYWFVSRRRYYLKNHGLLYAAAVDFLTLLGYAGWLLRQKLTGKSSSRPDHYGRDLANASVYLRGGRIPRSLPDEAEGARDSSS
jgi:N-acetylglucosaminyl-diphospho-decaprenol L-rhamnosyltransferase